MNCVDLTEFSGQGQTENEIFRDGIQVVVDTGEFSEEESEYECESRQSDDDNQSEVVLSSATKCIIDREKANFKQLFIEFWEERMSKAGTDAQKRQNKW